MKVQKKKNQTYKLGKIEVSKTVAILLSVIIMVFFFLLSVVIVPAIQNLIRNYNQETVIEDFIPVEAEIVSVSKTYSSGNNRYDMQITVKVKFEYNNELIIKKLTFRTRRVWYNDRYEEGNIITLYVNPNNKRDVRSLDGGFSPNPVWNPMNLLIVLLPIFVIAVPIIISIILSKRTTKKFNNLDKHIQDKLLLLKENRFLFFHKLSTEEIIKLAELPDEILLKISREKEWKEQYKKVMDLIN